MILCKLCELPLPKNPIEEHFCCSGCATVYKILGKADPNAPLFKEAQKAGLLSNQEKIDQKEAQEKLRTHFEIRGMWCPQCASAIQMLLLRQRGVVRATVDYATDLALVEYNPRETDKQALFEYIKRIGYEAGSLLEKPKSHFSLWLRLGFALFALLNLMMFLYPVHFSSVLEGYELPLAWLSCAIATPLFFLFPWRRLIVGLRTLCLGMESLIFLGISAAYLTSLWNLFHNSVAVYFDSMSMVMVSLLLGRLLEQRAKFSAKQTLFRITRSLPQKGRRNGQMVSIKEIKVGDELQLLLGEKVVLDGVVTKGEALVDESVMTGEARLVLKRRGERLIGGSIVRKGSLYFEVTANSEGSLISQILQFIERDLSSKKQVRLIDRITPIFIPIVILLGLLSGHLLEVLLVACPCAIGIAVPLIESRLIKRFADEGVLIRNRDALFRLGDDPYFIFDKTGTVTEGLFTLLSEPPKNPLIGRMAASTIHPAAQPLAEGKPLEVEEVIGRGLIFEDALLGSSRFLQERGVTVPTIASEHSLLFFAKGGSYQEHFEVGDRLRPFPKLNGLLLSGDRKEVVKRVADQLGLQWKAECDPLQKREVIQNITQTTVMVGDGVNDASALAAADVGISVTSGSDVSLQVADMVVSDLEALPALVALSKKGRRIARQNLFWAFSFNIVGIALAMLGLLQPLFAAAAMALSSLAVVISTARIDKKGGLKQLTSWNLHSGSEQRDVETKSVTL